MDLISCSDKSWFMSSGPDPEGYYHFFYSSENDFSHILMRPDQALNFQIPDDASKAMHAILNSLSSRTGVVQRTLNSEQTMRVEYLASNPAQEKSIRIYEVVNETFKKLDLEDTEDLWHPAQDLVARVITLPTDSRVYKQAKVVSAFNQDAPIIYSYDHTYDGNCYGQETAAMHPTVSSFVESTLGQIHSLEKRLEKLKPLDPQAKLIQEQIRYLNESTAKAKEYQKQHGNALIDSNYYRTLIREAKEERIRQVGGKNKLTEQDWENIQQQAAGRYIPFLVNCWQQTAQATHPDPSSNPSYSWLRFGAPYDARCALVPLDEFLDASKGIPTTSTGQLDEDLLRNKAKEIATRLIERPISSPGIIENTFNFLKEKVLGYRSNDQLLADKSAISYALSRFVVIGPDRKVQYDPDGTPKIDMSKLLSWIAEKRAIAQTQFLSLLQSQVSRLQEGDTELKWAHISLLKPHEDLIIKGWTHSEKMEVRDIKWVFDHFRGAKIHFSDVTSPQIEYDPTGKPVTITLSRALLNGKNIDTEVELKTYCISSSTASTEANKSQETINADFFNDVVDKEWNKQFKHLDEQEQKAVQELRQGNSSFYSTEHLAFELVKRGWCFSTCCQSGKDRTGYVCSRLAQRIVLDGIKTANKNGNFKGDNYQKVYEALDQRPFDAGRVTQKILAANTGSEYVKVVAMDLPGSDPLYMRRISHYAGSGYEYILGTPKVKRIVDKKFHI